MTKLDRRTVRSGPVDLAVFEGGNLDGPTLVMVHGWPDTSRLWTRVVEHLAEDFHVVAYDTRGQGESTDPGSTAAFALPELAKDFFAVVDAVSPHEPVHVLGHDWGSVQVWEAVCEPGAERRVASFTSISGPNVDHLSRWARDSVAHPSPRRLAAVAAQGLSSSYIGFFVSPAAPPLFRRFFDRQRWTAFLRRAEGIDPEPDLLADTLADDMVNGLRYYRANVHRGLGGPRERRTAVPVLLLVPTKDKAIRDASYDETAHWVDRLQRVDVPYGHWLPMAAPEVVAAETAGFIRSLSARPV